MSPETSSQENGKMDIPVPLNSAALQELKDTDFSQEELAMIQSVKKEVNLTDTQTMIQFGVGVQKKIADFADSMLKEIPSKDAGETGELLRNLMLQIKDLDVDSLGDGAFWAKLPVLGQFVDATRKFLARYEKVTTHIDSIVNDLHSMRLQLMKDVSLMDVMYQKNLDYYKMLRIYIRAGEELLQELNDVIMPEIKAKAEASGDAMATQKYHDMLQQVSRFEKKLHDLRATKMISIQTAPQIKLIQNGDQLLVEKIQSSILTTIPLWKNQLVIAVSLVRQKKAAELQKEVTDTTNELLARNSEMLKQSSIEIARESERGIVEMETLRKVNNDLVSTIDETLKIQSEGRQKRKQAEVEIQKLENELRKKLLAIASEH